MRDAERYTELMVVYDRLIRTREWWRDQAAWSKLVDEMAALAGRLGEDRARQLQYPFYKAGGGD
jgi:hypothetical protein